jgi:PDZ domain
MRFAAAVLALTFASSAYAQAQPPADLDPNNDPKVREEINKIHQDLSNMLRQQSDFLRTITPNAGIIPLNGMPANGIKGAQNCINGNCGPMERLYGPGRTGLVAVSLPTDIRAALKVPNDTGILVKDVYPDTPAYVAGYQPGDVLVEFNNTKVPNDLSAFMGYAAFVKNDVPVGGVVLRGDKRVELKPMVLSDRRVIPAPVMVGDLTPRAINPREQSVVSNDITFVSGVRGPANGPFAPVQRFDGLKDVTNKR